MTASRIRVLDDHTINKIAAGEVIENPASVVKELVENSLDAGATEVTIEIRGGGRQLIRVSDNGCGMSQDDAILCLERHATSKIKQVEDIQSLITMGFRGEAIPSIASISKFMLLTAPQTENEKKHEGTMVMVDGGKLISCSPAARSSGTTIEVKSLFFNVPVRKKFQRSPTYDTQEILKIISLMSLGYPSIKFELISDQKLILNTSLPSEDGSFLDQLGNRIETVLGRDFYGALRPMEFLQEPYTVQGYIGIPTYNRHNRTGQHLFINRRAVSSSLISFAIREGYSTMLAANRYPVFVLHIQMPGDLVDVNVHPQKKEVRLRQEQMLKERLIQAVQSTIRPDVYVKQEEPPTQVQVAYSFPEPVIEEMPPKSFAPMDSFPFYQPLLRPMPPAFNPSPKELFQYKAHLKVLAVLSGYIVLDASTLDVKIASALGIRPHEGICLVDQKAAYARLIYDQLLKQQSSSTEIQSLLIPITVELSLSEAALLKEYLEIFNQMGISIQEFGEHTFKVDALPPLLQKEDIPLFLTGMLQDLKEVHDTKRLQKEREKQLAMVACRRSTMASKRLSLDEAHRLVTQLMESEQPLQCPMGRSTFLYLLSDDLIKLFQNKSL